MVQRLAVWRACHTLEGKKQAAWAGRFPISCSVCGLRAPVLWSMLQRLLRRPASHGARSSSTPPALSRAALPEVEHHCVLLVLPPQEVSRADCSCTEFSISEPAWMILRKPSHLNHRKKLRISPVTVGPSGTADTWCGTSCKNHRDRRKEPSGRFVPKTMSSGFASTSQSGGSPAPFFVFLQQSPQAKAEAVVRNTRTRGCFNQCGTRGPAGTRKKRYLKRPKSVSCVL